ncbi:RING finger protein 17, partial [Nestor notabilis]
EDIDEALCIAICNLGHLHDAKEMLKYLELKVKQEGEKIAETADRKFDELTASLLSRKKKLRAELVKSMNNYSAGIAKAKEVIEEKKKCLIGVVRIAKELKVTPSVRTYCDLSQVIYNLKLPVEDELSIVNSLEEKISPRFFLNTDEITSLLKNLGRIEWGTTGQYSEDTGQHTQILDDKEEMSDLNRQSSVQNIFSACNRKSKIKALGNKLSVHKEVGNTPVEETLPMLHEQSIPALLKTPPSPDVIIEEIFEDDLESKFLILDTFNVPFVSMIVFGICFMSYSGFTELVFVTHVINPCHFYVRRYSQKREAGVLEKKLKSYCDKSSCILPSDVLELGARTFIKSKETGVWCRGTITDLIPLKSENEREPCGPIRYKVCDIALLEVFLIDFGSSIVLIFSGCVPSERPKPATLQTIETDDISLFIRKPDQNTGAELAAVPPLAVRCSLKDVVPKNSSEGWGEKAKTTFLGMVNNKTVLMTIFREEDGVLIVDLKKPPFNNICSNMPLSLKDALIFLDLARFRSQLPSHLEDNAILKYSPPKLPQEGEGVYVAVCHINSPSDFYLQLKESLDFLAISEKIQEIYKCGYRKNLQVACPVEGQACVAKQEDGNWYRAQIIGLPSHQEVTVKYVDYGNIANVTLKDVRRVKKEFLSFPEKAIRCRLAYIEPYKGANEWSREAKERFEEITEDKLIVCSVVEILDNNILSVELFDSSAVHGGRCSINCQLVKEDLASNIPGCVTAVGPKEIWSLPIEEIPETSEALNPIDVESMDEADFRLLCNKQLQVRISHVVSPSKIFVRCLSSESILKSLQEKMAAIYKELQPQVVKWESGMHCAVYVCDFKQWERGQISRIISETSAEVMLYDSGAEKTVDICCLRKLEESMKLIRTLAIECSLADIRPTGGSTQWTTTACECLSYYLTGAEVKITIQESDGACALPVKILCRDETGELVDISEQLIKKGLASRNRRADKADVACSVSKEHLKVHLKQENTRLDSCNSKTVCARNSPAPDENIAGFEHEQIPCKTYNSILHSGISEAYKSPVIPEAKVFQAIVSSIGHDGTIYIIPKSSEIELSKLMAEIQSKFKCLGLLEPYCWKRGEACVVRGSDTMWYRGKIVELCGSTLQVQYIDHGCIERIPQCHLYPTTLYTDIPPFCIPCQLYKTIPIGSFWQQDAVDCLQGLLTNEEVEIHVQELPDNPWGKLSISLYFGGVSLSSFMAYQKYCVAEDSQDMKELELFGDVPVAPSYKLPSLPLPGDTFPVRVTHLVNPKEVYICLDPSKNLMKQPATEGTDNCDSRLESLDEALKWCNKSVNSFPLLTHFQTEMPCLVEYQDGLWYRAKLLSVMKSDPVKILVQFVDYGSFSVVPSSRLRHIPYHLLKYPVQAVRALLAGFKPALYDRNVERIPYSPEWSVEALWAMIECIEGKQLSASIVALAPEVTISLYEDDKNLVHMKLIEMGLADLDE